MKTIHEVTLGAIHHCVGAGHWGREAVDKGGLHPPDAGAAGRHFVACLLRQQQGQLARLFQFVHGCQGSYGLCDS